MSPENAAQHAAVVISHDKLAADLQVEAAVPPGALDEMIIVSLATQAGVTVNGAARTHIRAALESLGSARAETVTLRIATGVAPQHAQDGRIEFLPGVDPDAANRAEVECQDTVPSPPANDSTDHYNKLTFTLVAPQSQIAVVHPPTVPVDGVSVLGTVIAARTGAEIEIRTDDSVVVHHDGRVTTTRAGVVCWQPPRLRVIRALHLPGHVDFSTGNIDFPGSVSVARAVRDKFKVRAAGDLTINGLVESAAISAGRDANLSGGMAAKETGTLDVGRDAKARYLNNATVSIGRDLTIDKELVNSRTVVGREFKGANAGIIGGRLACASAVQACEVGSEVGVTTELTLGSILELEQVIATAEAILPQLTAQREKYQQQMQPLKAFAGKIAAADIERLCELEFFERELSARITALELRLHSLRATHKARAKVDLTVHGRIHPKVLINTGTYTIDFFQPCRGPLRILNSARGEPELCNLDGEPMEVRLHTYARVRRIDGLAIKNAA